MHFARRASLLGSRPTRRWLSSARAVHAPFNFSLSNLEKAALDFAPGRPPAELHEEIVSRFGEKTGPFNKLGRPPKKLLLALSLKTSTLEEAELLLEAHDMYVSHQYPLNFSHTRHPLLVALMRARHWDALIETLANQGKRQVFLTDAYILGHAARGMNEDKQWDAMKQFAQILPNVLTPERPPPISLLNFTIRKLALGNPDLGLGALRDAVAAGVPLKPSLFSSVMTPLLAQSKVDDAMSVLKLARVAAQTPVTHRSCVNAHSDSMVCQPPTNAGLVQLAVRTAALARAGAADADIDVAVEVISSATTEQRLAGKARALELPCLEWDEEAEQMKPGDQCLTEESLPSEVAEALRA